MAHQLKKVLKPHRNSLSLAIACLLVLGLVFLLTVAKDLRNRQRLEQQLSEASSQANTRKILAPLVVEFQSADNAAMPGGNGIANPLPVSESSAKDYEKIIGRMLRQCDLKQTALVPDIQSILSDKGFIRVDLTTRGAFPDFRRLILQLGRLPFLSGIDRFRVQRLPDTAELEMFLQLRIQLVSSTEAPHENQ